MTKKEFDRANFKKGMKAIYRSYTYQITDCHYLEYLLELKDDEKDYIWVRCENVELVDRKQND